MYNNVGLLTKCNLTLKARSDVKHEAVNVKDDEITSPYIINTQHIYPNKLEDKKVWVKVRSILPYRHLKISKALVKCDEDIQCYEDKISVLTDTYNAEKQELTKKINDLSDKRHLQVLEENKLKEITDKYLKECSKLQDKRNDVINVKVSIYEHMIHLIKKNYEGRTSCIHYYLYKVCNYNTEYKSCGLVEDDFTNQYKKMIEDYENKIDELKQRKER